MQILIFLLYFLLSSLFKYDAVLVFDTAWRQLQNCKQRKAEKVEKKEEFYIAQLIILIS